MIWVSIQGVSWRTVRSFFGFPFCIAFQESFFETFGGRDAILESFLGFWKEKVAKRVPKSKYGDHLLEVFFSAHLYLFNSKTYKCQQTRFQLFYSLSKKYKGFIHICTFYVCKTYKCAVTIFTIFNEKHNVKTLTFRTPQGLIFEQRLLTFAPHSTPPDHFE